MSTPYFSFCHRPRRVLRLSISFFLCVTLFLFFFPSAPFFSDQSFFSPSAFAAQKKKKKSGHRHSARRHAANSQERIKRRYEQLIEDALTVFRKRRSAALAEKNEGNEKIEKNDAALPVAGKALPKLRSIVTSLYGERRSLGPNGFYFHSGLDIRAHLGWSIVAFRDGVVTKAGRNGNAGIMVEIEHDNGMSSLYAHMRRATVSEGQHVVAGEKIGEVGCTGRTTGAHLHVAIRKNGDTVDPLRYLKRAEDVLRPREDEIPDVLAPQQCNGHMMPYTPAAANRRSRGVVIRGKRGKPVRVDLNALRNYRPPEIPMWQGRRH